MFVLTLLRTILLLPMTMASREHPSRIIFGSCNSQHYPQVLWPHIRSRNATAFVWAGDAIYADKTELGLDAPRFFFGKKIKPYGNPEVMHQLYQQQLAHEEYSQLLREVTVFGTFDDHDYGIDNGDKTFPFKREAAIEFVETFLQFPKDSIMAQRARSGDGVYGVKIFDFNRPKGFELLSDSEAAIDPIFDRQDVVTYSDRSVAVFVLDIRSQKTPWIQHRVRKFFPDYDGDFLGEVQWEWFEKALSRSKAAVNVVVNGLQVHADKFPDPNVGEGWSRFPTAQSKLYNVLLASNVQTPILLSGDVHHASFSQKDCIGGERKRSLLEMTTSGMTHSWSTYFCAAPSPKCQSWYTTFATKNAMKIGYLINPWSEVIVNKGDEGAKSGLQYTLERNFGELEFDWENRSIQARIFGIQKEQPLLSIPWKMENYDPIHGSASWQCVNYRGSVNVVHKRIANLASVGVIFFFAVAPTIFLILIVSTLYRFVRISRC